MPFYEYESESGSRHTEFCLLSQRQDEITINGELYRRIQSAPARLQTGKAELREHYAEFRQFQKSQGITQDSVDFTLP